MSQHSTTTGRLFVECDNVDPVTLTRCARKSYGRRDPFSDADRTELGLFDLPGGWSVAPYSKGIRHDVRSFFDDPRRGEVIPNHPLAGITGDLHTCPSCDRSRARA